MNQQEQRIRELAYEIWQSEGRPTGQEERHWEMACKLVETQGSAATAPAKPVRSRKAAAKPVDATPASKPAKAAAAVKKPRAPRSTKPADS